MLTFSLIICSRCRPALLERVLRGVALLHYPAFELIVIYDPADAESAGCLTRFAPGARAGMCGIANLAMARNIGLSMARGEVVAFLDDDAVPEPDWLDRLAGAYADDGITAAGGFIRARDGVSFQYRAVVVDEFGTDRRYARLPPGLPPGGSVALTGTNFSVRRAAALAVGGFDENYSYFLEETDFLRRLQGQGGRVALVAGAEVHHGYAANASRDARGVPQSWREIARSKAYFAHINRRPETSLAAVASALQRFATQKRRQIWLWRRLGRLGAAAASRLRADLQAGLQEGAALARSGRRLAGFSTGASRKFEPYMPQRHYAPRQPVCVLAPSAPRHWPAIHELARGEYHVTIIFFAAVWRRRVTFADGLWQHELPVFWRLLIPIARHAAGAEVKRVAAPRGFTQIFLATRSAGLTQAAAGSGLPWAMLRPASPP